MNVFSNPSLLFLILNVVHSHEFFDSDCALHTDPEQRFVARPSVKIIGGRYLSQTLFISHSTQEM